MSNFNHEFPIPDFGIPGSSRLRAIVNSSAPPGAGAPPASRSFIFPEFDEVDDDIENEPLPEWNKGVFSETLFQFAPPTKDTPPVPPGPPSGRSRGSAHIRPGITIPTGPLYRKLQLDRKTLVGATPRLVSPPALKKGTLDGTKVAATEVYKRILQRHGAYFDTANFEPSAPQPMDLKQKQYLYTWQLPKGPGDYPPHLAVIPKNVQNPLFPGEELLRNLFWYSLGWVIPKNVMDLINRVLPSSDIPPIDAIFNAMRLMDTAVLLGQVIPEDIIDWANYAPDQGQTILSITKRNEGLVRDKKGIYTVKNVGSEFADSWFTDNIFAQQHLTGPNPCTLELATQDWISQFRRAAEQQRKEGILRLIEEATGIDPNTGKPRQELYVQDYSYFRKAINVPSRQTMTSQPDGSSKGKGIAHTDSSDQPRWAVAAVCLFHLSPTTGHLHPLAIVTDYKGKMEDSVCIFNRNVHPAPDDIDGQAADWPWRYAKTCVQISDWTRHEVTVHLVQTHFIEEAVIVAANRAFPAYHAVYRLLSPHWIKTLSLNAAARTTLVPDVVIKLAGMTAPQLMLFIRDAFSTFDWQANYIPTDLTRRGFPVEDINHPRMRNCAYARNMHVLWQILQTFVAEYLEAHGFTSDEQVAKDEHIQRWCMEMTSLPHPKTGKRVNGASIKNFPFIQTRKDLIDAVTMCIHIAAPQHTAVNYLQEYYQTFVLNKPPALYSPPVASLSELQAMTEKKLMAALPIDKPREWLLAAHLPHLLNMTVAKEQNLENYARSVWESVRSTDGSEASEVDRRVGEVAKRFWEALKGFGKVVERMSREVVEGGGPEYKVLMPDVTAVSILI